MSWRFQGGEFVPYVEAVPESQRVADAARWREMRDDAGLTLEDAARISGIPAETIADAEAGVYEFDVYRRDALMRAYEHEDGWLHWAGW